MTFGKAGHFGQGVCKVNFFSCVAALDAVETAA